MFEKSNEPLAERYRITASEWVAADEAASLLEKTREICQAEMISKLLEENLKLPVNKAELIVKSGAEYRDFIVRMVKQRSAANLLKVQMEYIRMLFSEQQSREATARAESRL